MKAFNKIMGSFRKTVDKLEKLEQAKLDEKLAADARINYLTGVAEEAMQESDMAGRTAAKIRAFYEVD